jgi:glycosyltransferase involved in cell wall biosynthesis
VLGGQEGGEGVAAAYIASVLTRTPVAIAVQCNVTESLANAGGWTMPVLRHAYPRFDRLFCASSGVADTAVIAMNAPRERLRVIRNGTDVARVQRLAAEPPPSWLPDRPFVVSVGRLAPQKGYDLLIRAYAQAREQGLSDALVILGEGDERPALERLVAELGLGDHVHLPGYQANPFPVVGRASTYCMSSRFEGYGLVLAEALALGLPVISTDCVSGPREVLADGEFGLLVEPGSVEALAQALVENGRHPERLRAKAEQATAHVDRFSVEGTAHAYMEQLGQLVR